MNIPLRRLFTKDPIHLKIREDQLKDEKGIEKSLGINQELFLDGQGVVIKKISEYSYFFTFNKNTPLNIPDDKNKIFVVNSMHIEFDPNETISNVNDLNSKFDKEKLRSNLQGIKFPADRRFIEYIGKILNNGFREVSKECVLYENLEMPRLSLFFDYKDRKFSGDIYDFRLGMVHPFRASYDFRGARIMYCRLTKDDVDKIEHTEGVFDTTKLNGVIPNNFNWNDYHTIRNQFGDISIDKNNPNWFTIKFSFLCKGSLDGGDKLPDKIHLYVRNLNIDNSPANKTFYYASEVITSKSYLLPAINLNGKQLYLIDILVGKALAMVIHGTQFVDNALPYNKKQNKNYVFLNMPESFWIRLPQDNINCSYIDLSTGTWIKLPVKNFDKNIKLNFYGYMK